MHEGEAPQFGAAFVPNAETTQFNDDGVSGGMDMPGFAGAVQPENGIAAPDSEAPQFGATFVPGAQPGQIHEDSVAAGSEMPAFQGTVQAEHGFTEAPAEAPQFGSVFVPEYGVGHEGSAFGGDSDGFSHNPGAAQGTIISENGVITDNGRIETPIGGSYVGPGEVPEPAQISEPAFSGNAVGGNDVSESDSYVPQFGAGFVGGGNANEYGNSFTPSGEENGHHGGDYSHGGDQYGGYAEAPLVAATFPSAREGTMLRTVSDGVLEASSPDGGNTLWYNSAYYQEPDAPHSVMEAANGVQWYAMQQQAHAPQFESGAEASQYNQAAFQNFMPGYEGQVAHVDGSHRLDGHFEVRNADGSGTAFYDTARYAAPRGDYQVLEDSRGSQWYAIRGEAAVDRKPVFENGNPVYEDGKLRMENVATVRYRQTPSKFSEPQKRGDIDRKPPRRKQ